MRPEFKFGLLAGAGICLWIVVEFCLGLHTTHPEIGERTGYFSNLVPVVTLFFLLRTKRNAARDGWVTLGHGLGSGLIASFISALVVYTFMVAYNLWINPDWLDTALLSKVTYLRAHGTAESEIRRQITFYRNANTPAGLVADTLLGLTVMGGIISFVLTLFFQLRPRPKAK